jgi:hypothetical protein
LRKLISDGDPSIRDVRNLFYRNGIVNKNDVYKICKDVGLTVNDSLAISQKVPEPYA